MKTAIVQSQGGVTLAGGAAFTQGLLKKALALAPVMVAADSGADRLLALGHEPEAVIGDFDSISDQARECLAGRLHEIAEQETTDFDKALRSVAAPFVLGVGFDGARLDHGLAALNGLVRHPDRLCILLGAKDLVCLAPMEIEMRLPVGMRLSLFPMGEVRGESEGLRWPLHGLAFAPDAMIGTSNEVSAARVRLRFSARKMLLIAPLRALRPVLQGFGWPDFGRSDARAR
ncbi:MAG: thiamine diphosphokinase [Cypionkella sp.]